MSTVAEIYQAIEKLSVREQLELLQTLPDRLRISPEDLAWTKAAESSFDFWDNPDDAIYDHSSFRKPKASRPNDLRI